MKVQKHTNIFKTKPGTLQTGNVVRVVRVFKDITLWFGFCTLFELKLQVDGGLGESRYRNVQILKTAEESQRRRFNSCSRA